MLVVYVLLCCAYCCYCRLSLGERNPPDSLTQVSESRGRLVPYAEVPESNERNERDGKLRRSDAMLWEFESNNFFNVEGGFLSAASPEFQS